MLERSILFRFFTSLEVHLFVVIRSISLCMKQALLLVLLHCLSNAAGSKLQFLFCLRCFQPGKLVSTRITTKVYKKN